MNNNMSNFYKSINNSVFFYIPYFIVFLKSSYKIYSIVELCFYFIFIFDDNYNDYLDNINLKSNFTKKLREYNYYKSINKHDFLCFYQNHFLKMLDLCIQNKMIQIDDGKVYLTDKGFELEKIFSKRLFNYDANSLAVKLMINTKKWSGLVNKLDFLDLLEKIGVKSL